MSIEEKLIDIYFCIENSCNSSVRIFDQQKGHSSRSVGFAAYEERQQRLLQMSLERPNLIEFLCKKGGHNYFKFEGQAIKIISSPRDSLAKNVFEKNMFEKKDEEFERFDPLLRIIYSADYDIESHEASISGCHYLKIDRNTGEVLEELNLLELAKGRVSLLTEVANTSPSGVELPAGGLVRKSKSKNARKLI